MTDENSQNLIPISIEDEMKSSYLDYSMSVIVSRAIPDVRDGLKPVHRRILYSMYESGYYSNKPHRKSARIVGDVIGKYHPHGEGAVYDSLVRMAQDFALRNTLVDGQGNFGSVDGDSAAAMRYTESRLEKISHKLLEDIDKDTVDFVENYDGSELEPRVLPSMFPNILVNGSGGIAVGMATNIPPHNLGEVIDACCLYIDNENIEILDLISVIKGPDFPTGGIIRGKQGIQSAYLTGRGSIITRGKAEIQDISNGRQSIIITEIPYMVNKAKLIEKIADLVREKRVEGISDLRDESDRSGMRIVIELKKDVTAELILNQLYSYTSLQNSFGVIMIALDNGMPKVMNLKEIILAFVKFREIVITRRTIHLLNKARDRAHLLIGLGVAVNNIDTIIKIIKTAKDPSDAKTQLITHKWNALSVLNLIKLVDDKAIVDDDGMCQFTELQAKAILEMRLQRLTALEKNKIDNELNALAQEITKYLEILTSRTKLMEVLKNELIEIKNTFASPRLSVIEEGDFDQNIEDLIEREEMVVTFTIAGYIKRVPLVAYKAQHRGGKGRSGSSLKDQDIITKVFVGSTHTPMLFFSNTGQVYNLKLYRLPLANPQSRGRPIVNILPLSSGEYITNVMPMPENMSEWDDLNIMFATAKGNVRRNDLSDFKRIQSNGKIAIRLDDDDQLVSVKVCSDNEHVLLATVQGKAIRFSVGNVRVFKSRTSDGVRGIKLSSGDRVISMTILKGALYSMEERKSYLSIPVDKRLEMASGKDFAYEKLDVSLSKEQIIEMSLNEEFILTVAENGFGKRTSAYEYRVTARGGTGIMNMDLSRKTGNVVSVIPVAMNDDLMLITDNGQLIRCKLGSIRITGRSTSGVILFKTSKGEKVVSVSLVVDNQEENDQEDI